VQRRPLTAMNGLTVPQFTDARVTWNAAHVGVQRSQCQ